MPNLLPLLRVVAPITITISVIVIIALDPKSATYAICFILPVNAAGWPAFRSA
jgi:hypothetical protein